ncbi:MAG: UvrD-helicase domain-containing protein [Micrococcales bacterium]
MNKKVTADQAYQVFKQNPSIKLTAEQVDAVENAATDWPSLVVAGAGSGKTELMATRVVWLVANGICKPEQVLGLTFTRKAASELSRRINNALTELAKSEFWPLESTDFASPNITTYNSYANTLYRDYALALGYEDDATLLSEAGRYQLAREVVLKYGELIDPRLIEADLSINQIVEGVLTLAGAMNDHGASAENIEEVVSNLYNSIAKLPAGKAKVSPEQPIGSTLLGLFEGALHTPMLARLAQGFIEEKRRRGYIDFSDQVALADRAVRELGDIVRLRETGQYEQILLDEYQDTSTLQTRLLAGLYAGKSVFAVGDPNQSIYGWRGASASNLGDYLETFGTKDRQVRQFPLTTSWRNPKVVLDLANVILEPLAHQASFLADRPPLAEVDVRPLQAPVHAPDGEITVKFAERTDQEAKFVADWLKRNLEVSAGQKVPTAAVLMRSRALMSSFESELREAGLAVEVVGIGGLLESPEVVDLIAALRVIHYPSAGANLMRLLSGPRWQVEPKDLERLSRYSRELAKFWNRGSTKVSGAEAEPSIVDALDYLLDDEDDNRKPEFTERGYAALLNCASLLRNLRSRTGMPLPEFVRAVEQELWLDIELAANPKRVDPMANLNGFANLVMGYAEGSNPTLGGFLEWLEYADQRDRFETPAVAARPGVVQLITAHAAKGLEWDLVAVPTLVEGTFPGVQSSTGWLSKGELPFPLRGDFNSLPVIRLEGCADQTSATKALNSFKENQKEYLHREERRVAYVALTRPRQKLLLSGSRWKPGLTKPVEPSRFLVEAAKIQDPRVLVIDKTDDLLNPLPLYEHLTSNPIDQDSLTQIWPMEPLGLHHRAKVEKAAGEVQTAMEFRAPSRIAIDNTIDLLIAERNELTTRSHQVKLPVRISASRFKEFIHDLPKIIQMYRRPMPEKPYKQTMAGTLFHSWVEKRFGVLSNADELDLIDGIIEDETTTKTIEELREIFEESRFSKMTPHSIEAEIQVTIKGNTFICKLDAVFKTETGYEIVDWKTGKPPVGEKEIADRALQLALYRMAFARLHGVDPDTIGVCLYYVADNLEISPEVLPSENDLIALWDSVLEKVVD